MTRAVPFKPYAYAPLTAATIQRPGDAYIDLAFASAGLDWQGRPVMCEAKHVTAVRDTRQRMKESPLPAASDGRGGASSAIMRLAFAIAIAGAVFLGYTLAHADESLTLQEGDTIEHAAGDLYRIKDKSGRVKGYIEKEPVYDRARVTDRAGNTIGTIPDDLLDLDPEEDADDSE